VNFFGPAELERDFGFQAPAALHTEVAADMDCYVLTHCILQYLLKKNVQVYDRTRIEEKKVKKGEIVLATNGKNVIRCRHLVYANGYEAAQWLPPKFVQLRSTFVTISEHMEEDYPFWRGDTLVWTTGQSYLYARSTPDYRLMVGGRDENFIDPARRDRAVGKKTRQLLQDFHKIYPQLSPVPEFSWTGVFGTTPDGLPYIGRYKTKDPGIFALGYGGNGITFGQVAAKLVADLVQGRSNPGHALFSFERRLEH
jgi:glycine/D-amino acid oxidase-like deaminating enzyme